MARKDIHRPSALKVEDYHFIKFDYLPSGGDILGDASFLASGRGISGRIRRSTAATTPRTSRLATATSAAHAASTAPRSGTSPATNTSTADWNVPTSSNAATPHPSRRTSRRRWRPTLESGRRRRSLRRPVRPRLGRCGNRRRRIGRPSPLSTRLGWKPTPMLSRTTTATSRALRSTTGAARTR